MMALFVKSSDQLYYLKIKLGLFFNNLKFKNALPKNSKKM